MSDTLEKIAEEVSRIGCAYAKIYGVDCSDVKDCDACRAWKRNHVIRRLYEVVDEGYTPLPKGKDGKLIKPGHTYYGEDGKAWAIKAIGPVYCYGVDANKSGIAKLLRCEWLTKDAPDSWDSIERDCSLSPDSYVAKRGLVVDYPAELMRIDLAARCNLLIGRCVK